MAAWSDSNSITFHRRFNNVQNRHARTCPSNSGSRAASKVHRSRSKMSVCARSSRPGRLPSLEAASETYSESLEEFEAREKVCF